jgi:transcription initiation factor TFIIIB Brf1 subunit/transcription initiation factor TFIIB
MDGPVCAHCGDDRIVLDAKQGHTVCTNCGAIAHERVAAEDYESNRDYNQEHYTSTEDGVKYKLVRVNGKLRETEVKCNQLKYLQDLLARIQQPDMTHEFAPGVLLRAGEYIAALGKADYLSKMNKIRLIHTFAAVIFLCHEAHGTPVSMSRIRDTFDLQSAAPVRRHVDGIRAVLKQPAAEMTMKTTFEYKLRDHVLRKSAKKGAKPDAKQTRLVVKQVSKMMAIWDALEKRKEVSMMVHLQSSPRQCVELFNCHRDGARSKRACNALSAPLYECLTRIGFDFAALRM